MAEKNVQRGGNDSREAAAWVADAVATRRLLQLNPSMPAAVEMVTRARTHLESAATIAATDPTLCVSACHDAARQAISAHMRAAGYRAANEVGAHRLVVEYAKFMLAGVITEHDIVAVDELGRERHTAEYREFASRTITTEVATEAISIARRVVNAVSGALAGSRQRES